MFSDFSLDNAGTVRWQQLADRAVVTYENVPEYNTSNSNTWQVEMYFNGDIRLSYLNMDVSSGIVGLSEGEGLDPDFYESDLSAMGNCGPKPPIADSDAVSTPANTPILITLVATDDGLPEPATLDYIIDTLPSDGSLSDLGAGNITAVPYTLVGGGNQVEYTPDVWYIGGDSFTFKANDGGTPPEGGDSNVATIAIDVAQPAAELMHAFPMDSNPGWSKSGQWAFGVPTAGGSHAGDPGSGHTGSNVCGYNLSGDYASGMVSAEYLTTAALDCRDYNEVELRFWRWLGVERNPFDNATLEVSSNGSDWTPVWSNPTTTVSDAAWTEMAYDISAVADNAATVYVRWGMGPTDGGITYPGWNIDDVELWGVMIPSCPGDLDGDEQIGIADLALLLANYGTTSGMTYPNGDLDADGDVDLTDLAMLLSIYGQTCQ